MNKVRVGLIGLGSISFAHEAGYDEAADVCEIVALCDIHEEEIAARNNLLAMTCRTLYQPKFAYGVQGFQQSPAIQIFRHEVHKGT